MKGLVYEDTVTLSANLVINQQTIGDALQASGFGGFDGILGVGPVELTRGTVVDTDRDDTIPTVTDNLFTSGTISQNALGVFFCPSTSDASGELTFGGFDSSKTIGDPAYVPVTSTSPASAFWGIDQTISYGEQEILGSTAGIVDTGTTLVLIATDAFNAYKAATGAVMDSTTGLLKITPAQYDQLKTLNFNVGGNTYGLIPNAQIWPRALNQAIGGDSASVYLIVADIGTNSGQGLDFINGYTFLQRFYSIYDTTNHQVGFARTAYTDSQSN
jgi:pepsin A